MTRLIDLTRDDILVLAGTKFDGTDYSGDYRLIGTARNFALGDVLVFACPGQGRQKFTHRSFDRALEEVGPGRYRFHGG